MKKHLQLFSLVTFSILFFLSYLPDFTWGPINYYFRLDPLIALLSMTATRQVIDTLLIALVVLVFTMGVGRFFCAYLCPLGATIDGADACFFRRRKKIVSLHPSWRKVKYYLLFAMAAAALAGISLAYLFDPLVILAKFYAFLLYPLGALLVNAGLDLVRPLAAQWQWVSLTYASMVQPLFYLGFSTLVIFFAVILLGAVRPRFWCRNLCPLGALLGVFSRLGVFKRQVSASCNACLACVSACPMAAIPAEDPRTARHQECIQCLTCQRICPEKAITFPFNLGALRAPSCGPNLSRRGACASFGMGLAATFLVTATPRARLRAETLIRPPGAVPEPEFRQRCLRCGECMQVCLTNTLQPSISEAGLEGLWTPRMELRYAPCEQLCNRCGKVCPSQAIRSLDLEEKKHARVGTAVIDRALCLVWEQDRLCLICDEICPYNAIVFKEVDGFRRPFIVENNCNGCGYCEQRCPVEGRSAIVVHPLGEIRLTEGSFREEAERRNLSFQPPSGEYY